MAESSVVNHGLINSGITRTDAPPLLWVETASSETRGGNKRSAKSYAKGERIGNLCGPT